jgi:hypothetical protein
MRPQAPMTHYANQNKSVGRRRGRGRRCLDEAVEKDSIPSNVSQNNLRTAVRVISRSDRAIGIAWYSNTTGSPLSLNRYLTWAVSLPP